MIIIKTKDEIELIKNSALLVAEALIIMKDKALNGATTYELDKFAEEFAYSNDAVPGFKGYRGFPYSICASRNEEIVHGFPEDKKLKEGTLLSIDYGIFKDSYYGDAAITFTIGKTTKKISKLIKTTKECLYKGIEQSIPGNKVGDISNAIQKHAESNGYGVVKKFVGHGIGKNLHESPQIPNYGRPNKGTLLKEGMVIAIEPMLTLGSSDIQTSLDGWTVKTADGSLSAHFEHTIAITKNGPVILSKV